MNFEVTYHSGIYRDFCAIAPEDYPSMIHFYEDHETGIRQLEFSEYFEILAAYTYALYGINEHHKHIVMSDMLIAEAIDNNVEKHEGEDIFYNTLLRKAVSCNLLMRYSDAEHILTELIKMKPENAYAVRELRRCLLRQAPKYLKKARATAVILFLASAVIIFAELIFIRHLMPLYTPYFEYTRIGLFLAGILLLITTELLHRKQTDSHIQTLQSEALGKKKAG